MVGNLARPAISSSAMPALCLLPTSSFPIPLPKRAQTPSLFIVQSRQRLSQRHSCYLDESCSTPSVYGSSCPIQLDNELLDDNFWPIHSIRRHRHNFHQPRSRHYRPVHEQHHADAAELHALQVLSRQLFLCCCSCLGTGVAGKQVSSSSPLSLPPLRQAQTGCPSTSSEPVGKRQ